MSSEMKQDRERNRKFNRRTTTTPQPEQFPISSPTPTVGDTRTDLCDLRTKVWRINQALPEDLKPISGELRTALDALNLAIAKLVLNEADRAAMREVKGHE